MIILIIMIIMIIINMQTKLYTTQIFSTPDDQSVASLVGSHIGIDGNGVAESSL